MKKFFICGIGGLLGSKLTNIIKNKFSVSGSYNLRNSNFELINSYQLDLTNLDALNHILYDIKPDVIINATALNNVDYCETHETEANKINFDAVSELAKISNKLGSKLVHLSTDSVFDGKKIDPYTENDLPNPPNIYGKSKLLGENAVLQFPNNLVIRASVLYGWLPKHIAYTKTSSLKQFNFVQWLINELILKHEVKIIEDEFSSPIIAEDFAYSILHLIINDHDGLFHSAPPLCINRYDFSVKLANYFNLDSSLIIPTTIEKLGRDVTTAKNKCLNSTKIINTNFKFLTFEESFELIKKQMLI
jgi:dTDP-4-dehydrorhamnose reductase